MKNKALEEILDTYKNKSNKDLSNTLITLKLDFDNVKNVILEFTEILIGEGMPLREAIIEAGRTRMTPVLLTATATMLGLVPLAVGLNIDFELLFQTGNPHIFFGGDSVAFWGPLSWTMIFGLGFATILTLILVPVMLYLSENLKLRLGIKPKHKFDQDETDLISTSSL
jgi:Cu/Ag efflux pump CusA